MTLWGKTLFYGINFSCEGQLSSDYVFGGYIICQQWVVLQSCLIITLTMKERLAYSPKQSKITSKLSPQPTNISLNTNLYQSTQRNQDVAFRYNQKRSSGFKEFDNLKKVSEETSALRQTMNFKMSERILNKGTSLAQQQKPTKLNDFLRQTMGARATKTYSQRLVSDTTLDSYEIYQKPEYNGQSKRSIHHYTTNQFSRTYNQTKAANTLFQIQSSLKQYQRLNEKMERNRKIIDQLRKSSHHHVREQKQYLKNANPKSPTYIELDHQKQTQQMRFKKKKNEVTHLYLTPQVHKTQYDSPISSPLIQASKSSQKKVENTPPTSQSTLRRKASAQFHYKNQGPCDQFQQGKKLGQGKFGCVNIVRHKKTRGIFALKKIPKALIKSHMMVQQIALQIRLQICLNHRNILGMYGFFDDQTHLYIVLEYMDGGTLYQKLKKGKLSEQETAVVIKQITESIQYLHDLGIAHRDIKPQNIVISNNVYKLCDFGWAAMCNERRKTYCGTFDYVAPEILQGVQYDMAVDLWCLGVMTYQLMTGKAPFYHISRKETMKKILNVENQTIVYPEEMSQKAKDFIDKLIRKNPHERIKANEALLHPFLAEADMDL